MIRSLTRPQADSSTEGVVCSLSWETHPGQARVHPPDTQTADMFQIPLHHISNVPFDWNIEGVDGRCPAQGTDLPNCDESDSDISQTGNSVRGKALLQSKYANSCLRTGNEFRSRATQQSPDGPTVSPCSSTSGSSAEAASRSTSSLDERMLLKEVASRMPSIRSGQTIMASWTDIREIFFPQCTSPGCSIVLNALRLQLKYPHAPSLMHVCSQSEQMSFLQRHLHLVVPGTLLVDVEVFLKHRSFLQAMVETKHLVTADVRSLNCCYGPTCSPSNDQSSQNPTKQKLKMLNGRVLPVVVAPGNTTEWTGDGKEARGSMVPLTMLPVLFPRYQRQLLLMATRFITMKSRAVIRRCSTTEARTLNLWHLNAQGSNNQLVTSNDLLVRWQDVVTVVDPLVKHAARFGRSQSQQCSVSSTSSSCSLRMARHPVQVVTGVKANLMVGSKSNEKQSESPDVSAETWMPKILNCYSTSDKRVEGSVGSSCALSSSSSPSPPNSKARAVNQVPDKDKDKTDRQHGEELDQSQKVQQYITMQYSADDDVDEHVMHQKPISECSSSVSSCTLTPDSSDSGTLDALEKLCRYDSPEETITCNTQVLERPLESKQLQAEQRTLQHLPSTNIKFRKYTEAKPNQQKVFREGTRKSERIRDQSKVQNLQTAKNVPVKKMETPIVVPCGSPEETAKSGSACKSPDSVNTNPDKSSSSGISSDPTVAGDNSYDQRSPGALENDQRQSLVHGFKDIADLFTVLTNEEVSHKSTQLAAAEIEDLEKKNTMSKTRQLGDLSSKGLQIPVPCDIALLLPTLETSSPSKSPEKDTRHTTKSSVKNRNIYPQMVIEAQKCSLGSSTPDATQTHIKRNQVSVTDIMKSMDETFSAFKSDPIALVKAKMSSSRNLTGYVNTDYIRVTGPDPNITLSQNDYKHGSLPPLMKYNVEYTSSGVTSNALSNSYLQNAFQKNHFEPVEDSRDVSALLKCPTPVHQWSLLDNRSSPTKLKPQLRPLIACPPIDDSATLKPEVSSEISNPKDTKSARTVTPSPVKLVLLKTSSTNPSKKPQWNIKKVIRASNVPKKPETSCNERKARMDAEFNAMRARAIAKAYSAAAATVQRHTFAMTCNVMKPLCNKSASPGRTTGPVTAAGVRNNPDLAGQVRVPVKCNVVNSTSKSTSLGQIQTFASSDTVEYTGTSVPPGLITPSNISENDTTTPTVADVSKPQNASDKLKLSEAKANLQVKYGKHDVDSLSIVQKVDSLNIAGINPKTTDSRSTENVKQIADPQDKTLPDSDETSNSVLKEKVSQSKKRQRVGEAEERRSLESTASTVSSENISTYWSGFPLGQSSRRLNGPKLCFPSYTVDYFTPPDNALSQDKLESRPPNTSLPACTPASASVNIFTNTGNDSLPSYVNWQRNVQPIRYLIPVFTNAPLLLYPMSQQSSSEAQNREHLINSRSMSADRSEFVPHHEGRYLSQLSRSASLGYNDSEVVPHVSHRDSRSRGAYETDTSSHSSVDQEHCGIKHVQLPSFYKPLEEDETISRMTTNSTGNYQSVREPNVNSGKNKESVTKLDHTNSNTNKASVAVTLNLGKGTDVSEAKKAESTANNTTDCSEVNSEKALKVISLIPKNPVVADACLSSKSVYPSPCCTQAQDVSLAMQPGLGGGLKGKPKPATGALNHQAEGLEETEVPGQKAVSADFTGEKIPTCIDITAESRSGTSSKVLTAARPHIGPFHERVRLEACGNVHNIRNTGTVSKNEGHMGQQISNLKERGPIELASGESIRWNSSNHLWVLDKNTNNNCSDASDDEECQGSHHYQLTLSQKKMCKSDLLPLRTRTSRLSERPAKKSVHTVSSVTTLTASVNLTDVDDLLVTAMVTLRTLETCLSKGRCGSNSNNNCDEHVSTDSKTLPVNKPRPSHPTVNSSPSGTCQVKVPTPAVNANNQQPMYPLYCSMVKDEPIKKNILLRETLRNNFELIKEISKCICTCKDAVMFVKPGERESYTRFLKKQYLKSLRHCPLHSGESSRQYKQEILILLDCLCNKVGKGQIKIGGKGKAKRGARKKGRKVRRQSQGCIRSRPVRNQWELNVARHYLASYVNQHYKKEIMRRFMQEGKCLQSTTLSGVKENMQTKFIDVKDSDKRVYDIDSKTLSSKCEGNNSIDADREVRRQLKAQDRHSAQQELFMQILLRSKTRQLSGTSREDATADKTKDESTQGDWCSRIEQLNITDDCQNKDVVLNPSSVTCGDKHFSTTAHFRSGIQRREGSKTVGHSISYQEVFSDSNPDISYCGRVHISGLSLSYVMENGYKFLPLKQAIHLLPWCCCSISKAVLRTHSSLVRTFSTWEHVRLLDLLSGKGNQNNVQTGDVLVKLDTIIAFLPDIEAEVKLRHQTKRPKKGLTCKY